MRFTITLTAATDDRPTSGISIAVIERDDDTLTIDDLGLRIAESKRLLAALQLAVVQTQALDWCRRQRACPCCGSARQIKDHRRSEEHTSELQSLMRNSYAVFCLKKKKNTTTN